MKFPIALLSEEDLRAYFSIFLSILRKHQKTIYSFLALGGVFVLLSLIYIGFEYYLKTKRIPLVSVRAIVTETINKEIGKAVDLGVVDFSLREGLILEDLVISREEDFSFNAHLLKVKKVTFRLSSYFTNTPYVERIDFFSPNLVLENDEELEKKLIEYFQNTKIKEVIFHDTRINYKKGNSTILDWREGWDISFRRKNGKIFVSYDNGWFWVPNATRVKGEGYFAEGKFNEYKFEFFWKNYPSEEAPLLVNYLFGTNVQSSVLSGEAITEKTPDGSYVIKGDVEYENTNFYLPWINSYLVKGLRFKESFLFQENKETREYSSYDFQIKVEDIVTPGKEILLQKNILFDVGELEPLAELLQDFQTGDKVPLSGKLRGNLEIKETGEKNKWFKVAGEVSGDSLDWNSPLLSIANANLNLKLTEGNNLNLQAKGEVFGKPAGLELLSQLDWTRQKKTDGSFYYPLYSKSKGNLLIQDLVANNLSELFQSWKKETNDEIKERQEKLIPEEYFYQKKIYKYFLESMNLDLGLKISSFYPYDGSADQGEAKGSFVIKDGRLNFVFGLEKSASKLNISSYFATKTPNFSFGLFLDRYPWSESWMKVCGLELKPGIVSMDYSFASQGSDYYTLSKDGRINYYLKLENAIWEGEELWFKMNLPDSLYKESYTVEFNLDHYFESDYIRNLSVTSTSTDLKGYGQNKSGFFQYSFYGLMGENRGNWSFAEDDTRCVIK